MKFYGLLCGLLALWVSSALCLPMMPDVQKDQLSRSRTQRELSCRKDEYSYGDLCCQSCPAGSYVVNHCTENHKPSSCDSCTPGQDFTISANGLEQCVSCRVCRQDEVVVQTCTLTSDAVCKCKPGTYCTGMCEICSPCSRCDKGKRIKEECNDTKNTVCEDIPQTQPTSSKASTYLKPQTSTNVVTTAAPKIDVTKDPERPNSETSSYFTPFIVSIIIIVILLLVCPPIGWHFYKEYRREKQNPSNGQNLLTNASADPSTNSSLTSLPVTDRANQGTAEPRMEVEPLLTSSNASHRSVTEPTEHSCTPGPQNDEDPGEGDWGGGGIGAVEGNQLCTFCEQLPPCECYWSTCFHCVINACPQHIVRIVRELHVPDTKIDCIMKDNPQDTYEQCYKLLCKWRTMAGKEASMSCILRVLTDMEMKGLAENIINSLRCKNITIV